MLKTCVFHDVDWIFPMLCKVIQELLTPLRAATMLRAFNHADYALKNG
jgi:hypothetical protein